MVVFHLLLFFCLLPNTSVFHLWKLRNNPERTKNISNHIMCSFFILFCFIFYPKSMVSAYLASMVVILGFRKCCFWVYILKVLKEQIAFIYPIVYPLTFCNLTCHLELLSPKCSVGDDSRFSHHLFFPTGGGQRYYDKNRDFRTLFFWGNVTDVTLYFF